MNTHTLVHASMLVVQLAASATANPILSSASGAVAVEQLLLIKSLALTLSCLVLASSKLFKQRKPQPLPSMVPSRNLHLNHCAANVRTQPGRYVNFACARVRATASLVAVVTRCDKEPLSLLSAPMDVYSCKEPI